MHPVATRIRRGLVALLLLLAVSPVRADENEIEQPAQPAQLPRSDAVYLLDVSGSMRKNRALARAQELLDKLLEKVVQPGTNVAFVPFGTGVHEVTQFDVPEEADGAWTAVQDLRHAIEQARAADTYTYLFEAVDKGLEILAGFKEKNPGHSRHIILVSDGKQLTRRGERALDLHDVLEKWKKKGFKGPEDWFIWYAYIGEPDYRLKTTLETTGTGQAIPLDQLASISWSYTRFDRSTLDLGRHLPGFWKKRARLVATTEAAGIGRTIRLRVAASDLPKGMELSVYPNEITLEAERTEVEVEFACTGGRGGVYEKDASLILSAEPGALHWIEPKQMRLRFEVAAPQISLQTARIDLGRIAPGRSAEGKVVLVPDEDATRTKPTVTLAVGEAAKGVTVALQDTEVEASAQREIGFTLAVPEDAEQGDYECTLRLKTGEGASLAQSEVTVAYRVGFGAVTVAGDALRFDRVLTGQRVEGALTLRTDDETAALGRRIEVSVGDGLPAAIDVEVPESVALTADARIPVRILVPTGVKGGTYRAQLFLHAPSDIRLDATMLPIKVTVVEAASLLLPPVVDLGDVPASRAREIEARFSIAVAAHQDGAELVFVAEDGKTAVEPGVVTLKQGTQDLRLKLRTTDVTPGARHSLFTAHYAQAGTRSAAGAIDFCWRVTETFFKVSAWKTPAAMAAGDGEVAGTLVVESSPDLAGKKLHLAQTFDLLATGMSVKLATTEVVLKGGLQQIRVPFQVEGARTGDYDGSLRLGVGTDTHGPLPIELKVAGSIVYLAYEGGLDGLQAGNERVVTLVLTAAAIPAPVVVDLAFERGGLPGDVLLEVPASVTLDKTDGVTRVPIRVKVGSDTPYGAWQPRLVAKARHPGVAVSPETTTIPTDVPDPITLVKERTVVHEKTSDNTATALWAGIAAGVVILVGLAAFLLGKRQTEVVHVPVPAAEGKPFTMPTGDYTGLLDEELVITDDEQDMIVVEEDYED